MLQGFFGGEITEELHRGEVYFSRFWWSFFLEGFGSTLSGEGMIWFATLWGMLTFKRPFIQLFTIHPHQKTTTLPETNIVPESSPSQRTFHLPTLSFRGYVSFREGNASCESIMIQSWNIGCFPPKNIKVTKPLPGFGPLCFLWAELC